MGFDIGNGYLLDKQGLLLWPNTQTCVFIIDLNYLYSAGY